MIRFCDKEVYTVQYGEMTYHQMAAFFANPDNDILSVIAIYDRENIYYGLVTSMTMLKGEADEAYIEKSVMTIKDSFWEDAREYFKGNNQSIIPVFSKNGDMLSFIYNDIRGDSDILTILFNVLERMDEIPVPFSKWKPEMKHIRIIDFNEKMPGSKAHVEP